MKRYRFRAKIEPGLSGGAYVFFPLDTATEFGTKGKVPVKGTFDGVPYTGSLAKYGAPQHILGVSKAIRQEIGKGPGDSIDVVLWKDSEERTVEVPAEFKKRMTEAGLLAAFEALSYTHRKEYCRWIAEAKKEETRAKRLAKAVDMLKAGVKTSG